jgi:YD repeat-containing protein
MFALLGQIFFITPLQKASAGAPVPTAPFSAPPEPFTAPGPASTADRLSAFTGELITPEFFERTAEYSGVKSGDTAPLSETGSGSVTEPAPEPASQPVTLTAPQPAPEPAPEPMPTPPLSNISYDFDGDHKADIGRWHSSTTEFKTKNSGSSGYSVWTLGTSSAKPTPGDFDGDGKTDAAVFSAGTWKYKTGTNSKTYTVSWGLAGDIPVCGDYDGDGKTDISIWRPSNGQWWIRKSSDLSTVVFGYGLSTDIPVPGDYDGDGRSDYAVFRPSDGTWYVMASTTGSMAVGWGLAIDTPVQGDFDGDGKSDLAVYRPTTAVWYVLKSSTNYSTSIQQAWGGYGDQLTPADYDGDGKTDISIWRATTGVWHTIKSSDGTYDYQTLGVAGDFAVPSAYTKQIGGSVPGYDLATQRLNPKNATGTTDLYSRNFSWGTSLAGLSGRAGSNAALGISYNSLVWLKNGSTIQFDPDTSNVSPGFRLGFPVIEPAYYDSGKSKWAYLMVTPSGGRVEFRQTPVSNIYETADSSYIQLATTGAANPNDPVEGITIKLTTLDGSQMSYEWIGGAFRCKEIKDRNGNFITIFHNSQGLLKTITDTLGRVITISYDAELYPTSISQTWNEGNGAGSGVTHLWASFTYTTQVIQTNFSGLAVIGPTNGTLIKVLQKIKYADNSYTKFEYNDYGQVKKLENYAADDHKLNHIGTDLDSISTPQSDCPRFTQTRSLIENFNVGKSGLPKETVVTNSLQAGQPYSAGGQSGTATLIETALVGHPQHAVTKTFVGESGWKEALPIVTEDWADGAGGLERKRWIWSAYTQDDTNLAYALNPRLIESKIGDAANIKRTTVEYRLVPNTTVAEYGLKSAVSTYGANQSTVIKRSETDYDLSSTYTSRRIIGLVSETRAYGYEGASLQLVSRLSYGYDQEGFSYESNQNIPSVIQHDPAYSVAFVSGRGNVTSVTRHDVTGQTPAATSKLRYDIAGSPVARIDPLNRKTAVDYTDVFNDTTATRNTYSYPTTLTDPAGNSSAIKYRFDLGANVWARSPAPAGNSTGKETTREYDSAGRLLKEKVENNGAYTRYQYFDSGIQMKTFSTLVDTNNSGAGDTADEVLTEIWSDGAGRVRQQRVSNPGSIGGYSGTLTEYNILGQVKRRSVPTEIDTNWNPAGDDAVRGWLWTATEYDWKSRVTRQVNTDGTDSLISYEGCGCAGGQITTVQGELVPRDDQPTVNARRIQKVYADTLGRNYKTELLDWDGNVYKTNLNAFNSRDQILSSREIAGPETSSDYQETSLTYDGHGRISTQHRPGQEANRSTAYSYLADDKIQSVTDAAGARESYTYNALGMPTRIDYDLVTPQNIDDLTPIIHGLNNGGPSNRYHITIKGNNFGTNPQVLVDVSGGSPSIPEVVYSGAQLQRSESNGDQYISIDLQGGSEQYHLQNPPGIGLTVKNTGGKKSGKTWIRVVLANVLPPLQNLEYTVIYDLGSTSVIPEAIMSAPSALFEYDNAGNMTKMTDGLGEQLYAYDQLSRLKSETRNFNEQLPAQVTPPNGFKIQYEYDLTGQLKKVTDPYGEEVKYAQDRAGRLSGVSGFQSDTQTNLQYVTAASYTAFGSAKKITYGNNTSVESEFNNRLQTKKISLKDLSLNTVSEFEYQYNNDGKLKFSNEHGYFPGKEGTDLAMFDRSFHYDFAGRLTAAKTGIEAHGQTETDFTKRPYRITYDWDHYGHLKKTDKFHWTEPYPQEPVTLINEREPVVSMPPSQYPPHWSSVTTPVYDPEGRKQGTNIVTTSDYGSGETNFWEATFDTAGRRVRDEGKKYFRSGTGTVLKTASESIPRIINGRIEKTSETMYFVYSSVLGEVINEIGAHVWDSWETRHSIYWPDYQHYESAAKSTNVYAAGTRIARTEGVLTQINIEDASGTFYQEKTLSVRPGTPNPTFYITTSSMELDPFRAGVGEKNPYPVPGQEPPPDDGCGGAVWGDGEWGNEPPCDDDGTDPPTDDDAGIGGLPDNSCILNGFETEDCSEAINNPDVYEEDPGDVGIATDKDGNRRFVLRNRGDGSWNLGGQEKPKGRGQKPVLKINKMTKSERREAKVKADKIAATGAWDMEGEFIDLKNDPVETITSKYLFFRSYVERNVKFVGDPNGLVMANKDALIARLAWLVGLKDCNDNFKKELGKTPFQLIGERGLYITDYGSLENAEYAQQLGISEGDRQGLLEHKKNVNPMATTTPDLPIGIVTVFNASQIDVSWLWSFISGTKEDILDEAVPHEMIHGAGKKTDHFDGGALFKGHDLNNWGPYKKVIDSCKIPLKSP